MKRAYRLRRPDQFQRVRRTGRSWSTPLLTLNAATSRRRVSRCGFVVGKRVGKAVDRNRARRRVREAVRLAYERIGSGWDLVFILRSPELATVEFVQLQTLVEQLLRRAGVWCEPGAVPASRSDERR
ncbi:MAG TPA: ribonuclease P protein component [Roseiflexaceae bacterium]|nr:ribonuclease P protein component [Roseiflexaceae bacterium]